jgi:hypothetical protein
MKPIPLYKLFNIVRERGGYDAVTREKLLWRKICVDNFDPGPHNNPQWAFQLKSLYYKQLAAYEIKRVHKQEPPPKSILENETAKGGELLTRTLENYTPRSAQKSYVPNGVDGHDSEMADEFDTNRTPKADRIDAEDPSSTGRVTRGRSRSQAWLNNTINKLQVFVRLQRSESCSSQTCLLLAHLDSFPIMRNHHSQSSSNLPTIPTVTLHLIQTAARSTLPITNHVNLFPFHYVLCPLLPVIR